MKECQNYCQILINSAWIILKQSQINMHFVLDLTTKAVAKTKQSYSDLSIAG